MQRGHFWDKARPSSDCPPAHQSFGARTEGFKGVLYHGLCLCPEDPRMTSALSEKCSASPRLKVFFK